MEFKGTITNLKIDLGMDECFGGDMYQIMLVNDDSNCEAIASATKTKLN